MLKVLCTSSYRNFIEFTKLKVSLIHFLSCYYLERFMEFMNFTVKNSMFLKQRNLNVEINQVELIKRMKIY